MHSHPTQGPFPESTLMRMLVKKLPGLDSSSYCWCVVAVTACPPRLPPLSAPTANTSS